MLEFVGSCKRYHICSGCRKPIEPGSKLIHFRAPIEHVAGFGYYDDKNEKFHLHAVCYVKKLQSSIRHAQKCIDEHKVNHKMRFGSVWVYRPYVSYDSDYKICKKCGKPIPPHEIHFNYAPKAEEYVYGDTFYSRSHDYPMHVNCYMEILKKHEKEVFAFLSKKKEVGKDVGKHKGVSGDKDPEGKDK